jgi:serine-type D-Ala-D-Ala carboxypeptidase/endopeptidase
MVLAKKRPPANFDQIITFMRAAILLCSLLSSLVVTSWSATPTAKDLVGQWNATAEFGKMKFKMVLRIAEEKNNRITATMDLPEHGQVGMPIAAVLFNSPDVRIEIDPFQTAFNGKLSDDLSEMNGELEEGPGGRPISLVFKRSTQPDAPEPEKIFTFAPGEARDIRGHWKANVEPMPGMKLTFGLNVGKISDGSYKASLDVLEQAAKAIPASAVTTTGKETEIKWDGLQMTYKGTLSDDGNTLNGELKQRGKPEKVTFTRLDAPATLIPQNVSYEPDLNKPDDLRGHWAGKLDIPNQKLRIVVKLGRTPAGEYAGTMSSPDQGGGELPMASATIEPPKFVMEWPAIRGKFEGVITNEGAALDGTWEQFGTKMPLKLERTKTAAKNTKP